jgi:D-tyrosyl-tRNA(Tyr) deacylase
VYVEGQCIAEIGQGLLILVGFGPQDAVDRPQASKLRKKMVEKIVNLRIFPDSREQMNTSLLDVQGQALLVSQFTLYADCARGRRPSFVQSLGGDAAREAYDLFVREFSALCPDTHCGVFGAAMDVDLCNWGPVTIWLDNDPDPGKQ